mgnify:CR=1 FL=1
MFYKLKQINKEVTEKFTEDKMKEIKLKENKRKARDFIILLRNLSKDIKVISKGVNNS